MGTTYNIKIVNDRFLKINAQSIQNDIDSILIDYNNYFSTYVTNSEIEKFNQNDTSKPIIVSDRFYHLFEKSIEMNSITNGAFDISVKPLVDLWGFSSKNSEIIFPDAASIDSTLAYTGMSKFNLMSSAIKKDISELRVDFNAIAKGDAVDIAASYLDANNISRYMVEIGGEIKVSGLNSKGFKWVIGIRNPLADAENILKKIHITDAAMATSGTYENYFEYNGNKYSHLINPVNGMPIEHDLISATVIANNAFEADAIATALMVMGHEESLVWIDNNSNYECMLISKDHSGSLLVSYSENFDTN